jgi:hypothetical protein
MAGNYAVIVEGLRDIREIGQFRDEILFNAVRAINRTADVGRTQAARRIGQQVAFPASYLNPAQKRLFVSRKATRATLEARITARARPTSLARFVSGSAAGGQGLRVEVKPGSTRFLRRAFLIKLRAGSANIDTKSNMGLAVRLKPGDDLRNKKSVVKMARGLYLLYGPSVDQVFLDNSGQGVADDIAPDLAEKLTEEFLRLMEL